MAKGLVFTFEGETSSFEPTKVDREKLYGRKQRVVVDEHGIACSSAHLMTDGATVVPSGGTSSVYVDAGFDTVERSSLKTVDADGKVVPVIPSTLGVSVPATGPVAPQRVLDHMITGVYQLQPESLGTKLIIALEAGQIFESRYCYRDGHEDSAAFLLKNEQGFFALIADRLDFDFLQRDTPAPAPETEGESVEDELDFSMM